MNDQMIDRLMTDVLRGLGVKPHEPTHWLPHIHIAIDRTTERNG